MLEIFVLLTLYGTFGVDYVGTYQAFPADGAIIRVDTRTGKMERCVTHGTPQGLVMVCEAIAPKPEWNSCPLLPDRRVQGAP